MFEMKHQFLYGAFAILFILASLTYVGYISPQAFVNQWWGQRYSYEEVQQGIRFVSNEAKPSVLLNELAKAPSFVLVAHASALTEDQYNAYWTQALVQQQIVLVGHDRLTLIIVKVFDKVNGAWKGCQTDFATAQQNEFISIAACQQLIDTQNSAVIETVFPDASLSAPIVEVTSQKITLRPVKGIDIPGVNFLLLRAMYSDAGQLIDLANGFVEDNNAISADANN